MPPDRAEAAYAPAAAALPLLQAPGLPTLHGAQYGFTTRHGGVSAAPYHSLNLSDATLDASACVRENQRRVMATLGLPPSAWRHARQVHGRQVVQVRRSATEVAEGDVLITCEAGVALAVYTADCVPIVLACPRGSVVACVHAGWRGTVAQVAHAAVAACCAQGGVAPQDLLAAIGPAIGPCCFRIDAATAALLQQSCAKASLAPQLVRARQGQWHADLWRLNVAALHAAGLRPQHVHLLDRCTHCDPAFFSHRRDAGRTGRQAAVVALTA